MPGCRQHWRPEAWHKGARSLGDAGPSAEANLVGVLEDYPAPLGQVPEAEQSHSSKLRLHPLFRFCLCFQRISDDLPQGALVSLCCLDAHRLPQQGSLQPFRSLSAPTELCGHFPTLFLLGKPLRRAEHGQGLPTLGPHMSWG